MRGAAREEAACMCCGALEGLLCAQCSEKELERREKRALSRLQARSATLRARLERVLHSAPAAAALSARARTAQAEQDILRLKQRIKAEQKVLATERGALARALHEEEQQDVTAGGESEAARRLTALRADVLLVQGDAVRRTLDSHLDSMADALVRLRWRKVVQYFALFPIHATYPRGIREEQARRAQSAQWESVSSSASASASTSNSASVDGNCTGGGLRIPGISTVLGMPVPNNCSLSVADEGVAETVLRVLAMLTEAISRTLNIPLPHPISSTGSYTSALIAPRWDNTSWLPLAPSGWLLEDDSEPARNGTATPPTAASSAAIHRETEGINERDHNKDPQFELAVALLQEDVLHICVRSGLSATRLFPRSAILLNLDVFHAHANEQYEELTALAA